MIIINFNIFPLLVFTWIPTGGAQYDECIDNRSWLGDGFCDFDANTPSCNYDGGDCCACTCVDDPEITCGSNGFDCKNSSCLDPDLKEEFSECDENNLLLVNDGECDANNNNAECGYDGGDCCLCTCAANEWCRFNYFNCVDNSAGEHLYQCQSPPPSAAPCAADIQQTWIIEDSVQARAMAEAVNCSGGIFNVTWKGFVAVGSTIYVTDGTVLNITGAGDSSTTAVMDGDLEVQLLTVINASLHVSDLIISSGSSIVGGAIVVSASNVTFTRTYFSGNRADAMGGAVYMTANSRVLFDGNVTSFQGNSAVGFDGALYASGTSIVRFSGAEAVFSHNTAGQRGGAIAIDQSDISWVGKTSFVNNTSGVVGGAVYMGNGSIAGSIGSLLFSENNAVVGGGALAAYLNSKVSWSGETTFEYNRVTLYGGAIFINGAFASWDGITEFTFNMASAGGALSVINAANVSWRGASLFVNNSAEQDNADLGLGGAIVIIESSMSWGGATTFDYNRAIKSGGAIAIIESDVSWHGSTNFSSNTVSGIMGVAGAMLVSLAANVSWSGLTSFFNNSAEDGGAINVRSGCIVSWRGFKTTFVSNMATSGSGEAIVVSGSKLSWSGTTILECNRASTSGGALHVIGAGMSWEGSQDFATYAANDPADISDNITTGILAELSWSGATSFFNNSALIGGAINAYYDSQTYWDGPNTTFFSNTATSAAGGAISVFYSNLSWDGATFFRENGASIFGGGVAIWSGSRVNWSGSTTFLGNKAVFGGAIFIYTSASVKWTGFTTFNLNEVETGGGAVGSTTLATSAEGELLSSLFIGGTTIFLDNFSERDGGAMFLAEGLSVEFESTAMVTFQRNSAQVAGGAVFLTNTDIGPTFYGARFVSNIAQLGGGIYATNSGNSRFDLQGNSVSSSPTFFFRCIFLGNTAIAIGGAIYSVAGQDYVMDTSFVGNTARAGGALYLAGSSKLLNCSFVENTADEGGGPAVSNIGYVENVESNSFVGNVYNCIPGTFRAYRTSDNLYDILCVDCDAPCEGCYFRDPFLVPYCKDAIAHSTSNGSSTTIESLSIDSGYWRATRTSKNILACYHPDACKGGLTGASNYCGKGYGGPYCAICSDGYTESLGFKCDKCQTHTTGVVLMVMTVAVGILAVLFLARYLISEELDYTRRGFVQRLMRYVPLQSIKIIIVAWQILTQFASVASITYPNVYQRFLDGVKLLNFDFSWILSIGCVFELDFHDRLLFATIGPVIAAAMLGVTYGVAAFRNRGSNGALVNVRYKHLSAVLLLTFLVYSSTSSILFQTFSCDSLDNDEIYLRADYRIQCDSTKHRAFMIYASFMAPLYALGIPAFYAALLLKNHQVLVNNIESNTSSNVSARASALRVRSTSHLWKSYKPKRFYYEVIECGRRILLTGVVVFIYPNTAAQIAISLVIAFTFAMLSEGLDPYASPWDTWVSRMGHIVVCSSVFMALLLKVDISEERSASQNMFEAILVLIHSCMVLAVIGEALGLACSLRTERQEDPSPRFRRMKWIGRVKVGSV